MDILSWVLVACALAATTVVVRREFVNMSAHASGEGQRPVYVDSWRAALEVGIRTGPEDAPVQLIEFADFECPGCAHFESTAAVIRERYPDQVSIVFSHSPLSIHKFSELAARSAECARSEERR